MSGIERYKIEMLRQAAEAPRGHGAPRTDRERAASAAGLINLRLLEACPEDMPVDQAMVQLRQQFGPTVFAKEVRKMSDAEYSAAKSAMLRSVRQ